MEDVDRHRTLTGLAAGGLVLAAAWALLGLPPVDLHGPLHRYGVMDPLCGGTRAVRLATLGGWADAWGYNPLGHDDGTTCCSGGWPPACRTVGARATTEQPEPPDPSSGRCTMTIIASTRRRRAAASVHPGLAELDTRRIAPAVWANARLGLGLVFFWAFLDQLFGLGFATPGERSWLNGGSPTSGYLAGAEGPFSGVFNAMSGQAWMDWLFMAGLLGIGGALLLGVAMRTAAASGALLLAFMYAASLPLENNPVVDDHLVYAVVLVGFAAVRAGDTAGLGRAWRRIPPVQGHGWLQ